MLFKKLCFPTPHVFCTSPLLFYYSGPLHDSWILVPWYSHVFMQVRGTAGTSLIVTVIF